MFINFDQVAIYKSLGVNIYTSANIAGLTPILESEYKHLHNVWFSYNNEGSGAYARLQLVHIGKRLEGNTSRLRLAVYIEEDRMSSLMLFQLNQFETAYQCLLEMCGYGEVTCVE